MTPLRILQVAAEVSPLAAGNLAESAAGLARALAEQGAVPTVLTICSAATDPARMGFARRLQRLPLSDAEVEVFEGTVTKGVPAWIVRAPAGMPPAGALAAAVSAALARIDIEFTVAHAHGTQSAMALDEIGRARPEAIRVATVAEPLVADIDAVVMPVAREEGVVAIAPGIDDQVWDPAADPALPARYDATDLRGKALCKAIVQRALGLAPRTDLPLIVARTERACAELAPAITDRLALAAQFAIRNGADVSERALWGGADFMFLADEEDAELDVLRALRYGAVPLVAAGSAAADVVVDYHAGTRSGLGIHYDPGPESLAASLLRACRAFADEDGMADVRRRALSTDVSWRHPARLYLHLFERLARD